MQAPPELVKQIVALPPGEVFILPAGEATLANLVRETRTSPVSENTAQKVALNYLKQKAISQTLKNQLAEIVKKNKDRVRYQSGYGPKVVEASRDIGSSGGRSEEHTSALQSLMRISNAVFCLNQKQTHKN